MQDCLFCKIAAGQIPSDNGLRGRDMLRLPGHQSPGANPYPHHPQGAHGQRGGAAGRTDGLLGRLFQAAARIAQDQGLDEKGFRLVTNCGEYGAQSVHHFHIHLLGGRQLSGQMG